MIPMRTRYKPLNSIFRLSQSDESEEREKQEKNWIKLFLLSFSSFVNQASLDWFSFSSIVIGFKFMIMGNWIG
ncbi:unnamed protein product [Lactuca virosa]|uniref:Uncharacterized protein n=1 Tax=Lactuca virosa TaxID=75947 RepID=A0AAU9MWW9_9ASTR|nr:unnamed protein product [Lactuca virosa]